MIKLYAAKITTMCIKTQLLLITLLLLSVSGFADERQHMEPVSLEERTQNSDIIIEGEVISQKSFWDSRHENIYTSNIIRVYKVFKGEVKAEEIELITKGGTVGMKMHVHSTALDLSKGEQGIFFLSKNQPIQNTPGGQRVKTRAYAGPQGFINYNLAGGPVKDVFNEYTSVEDIYGKIKSITNAPIKVIKENEKLKKNANNSQTQEQSSLAVPVVTSFSPVLASAGTRTILTINGSGFGATRGNGMVQFLDAQRGGRIDNTSTLAFMTPLPYHYISWSNTQIKLYIPSIGVDRGVAGTGPIRVVTNDGTSITTSQELVIEYAYSNLSFENKPFQPKLIDDNKQGGYTVLFAPSLQNRAAAREGFLRALNSWVCATEVNWQIGPPSTSEQTTEDGRNIVQFVPPSELGEKVLASTISRYEGCASSSDTLFYLSEFDMQINNSINWQYGPAPPAPSSRQFDFETVMLHELGHAHQLGHVILPQAVMLYAIAFEQLFRDLSAADVRGGTFVMANSTGTGVCRQSPMVPEPEGDCDLAPEIFTLSAAFQNQRVLVNWQTRDELAVDFFVVQRSENSDDWSDIATVDAKGPSTGILEYLYTDANPLPDISYYRIKVVYVDGASRLSPRVRVLDPASLRVLRIFPNPIPPERHSVRLIYLVNASTTMTIHLYDTTGKLVREYIIELTDVNTPIELPLQGLASGMYILRWQEKINSGEFKIIRL